MPVPKKRTISASEATKVESSSDQKLPDEQEFRQRMRNLAVSAMRALIEEVMREELEQCLCAQWGEITSERKGYRNGSYTRDLVTKTGRLLDLSVPSEVDNSLSDFCLFIGSFPVHKTRYGVALLNHPSYQALSLTQILNDCALCDTHGFLVTAKNAHDENEVTRARLNKETVMNFGYALALPNFSKETEQLHTRSGASKEEGQMLMKIPARSGVYALTIRYTCAGIGADTRQWQLLVTDPTSRLKRHRALLSALRDLLVSPRGATTGTMLPHFTGLRGAIVERTSIGRAPCLSGLDEAFLSKLSMMEDPTCHIAPFDNVGTFYQLMNQLIATTSPALHPSWKNTNGTA